MIEGKFLITHLYILVRKVKKNQIISCDCTITTYNHVIITYDSPLKTYDLVLNGQNNTIPTLLQGFGIVYRED